MKKIKNVMFLVGVILLGLTVHADVTKAGCCPETCSIVESSCKSGWYSSAPDCSSVIGCSSSAPAGAATTPAGSSVISGGSGYTSGTTGTISITTPTPDGWNIDTLSQFGLPDTSIYDIVSSFLYWILAILGIVGVIGFAISGLIYLLSAGNETATSQAKKAMVASILGVIIGLSGLVIIKAIDTALWGLL